MGLYERLPIVYVSIFKVNPKEMKRAHKIIQLWYEYFINKTNILNIFFE